MSIKDLQNINWEAVTIDDLVKAHELSGMSFQVDGGKVTKVFIGEEEVG